MEDDQGLVNVVDWISVKDRLPEKNQFVLTYNNSGNGYHPQDVQRFYDTYISNNETKERSPIFSELSIGVTHWMPLPKPPKEG
jgi:hypothetical protein